MKIANERKKTNFLLHNRSGAPRIYVWIQEQAEWRDSNRNESEKPLAEGWPHICFKIEIGNNLFFILLFHPTSNGKSWMKRDKKDR